MRRLRSNVLGRAVACWCVLAALGRAASAQATGTIEGALPFLFPTGARAVAMGQAVVASATGSEALWWNPALVARGPREVGLNLVSGQLTGSTDVSVATVWPVRNAFSIGLSVRYISDGQSQGVQDDIETGSFVPSTRMLGATFSAPFGDRFAAGLTLKLLSMDFSATGQVPNVPNTPPITGAIDAGVQYIFTKDSLLIAGASLLNFGLPLQINDSPQADAVPTRIDVGLQFSPRFRDYPQARLRLAGDVVSRPNGEGGLGLRTGGELSWMDIYHARAGYTVQGPNGTGPSLGGGVSYLRWRLDFAQFTETSGAGTKLTFVSVRYVF